MAPPTEPTLRALVTGLGGFTGRYVEAELAKDGYQVFGLDHPDATRAPNTVACDLLDEAGLRAAVRDVRPDVVVHLAAIAFVAHDDVRAIYDCNLVGTRNLLAALAAGPGGVRKILLASSANIYGNGTEGALDESTPAAPANDYAVSKLAMEYAAALFAERLPIVITRPFNYTGVGQSTQFLLPKIVDHFRRRAATIELGNLEVERDFSDVRDVAATYARLVAVAPGGTKVNVCSGRSHSPDDVLRIMTEIAGYSINVTVNPTFIRESEVLRLLGDRTTLERLVGSTAARPLVDTLRWMYEA